MSISAPSTCTAGEWDAAEAAYQHALNLNPDLTFARQSLANIEAHRQAQP